ncbi:MAG: DUF2442 domain-containing protein [Blastocatellia bacterium]
MNEVIEGSGNVFADLGMPNPEERQMRSALLYELHTILKARKLRKDAAAKLLELPAPVAADLLKGKFVDLPLAQLLTLLVRLNRDGTPSAVATFTLARIVNVLVTDDTLSVDLEDGRTVSVPIGWYPRLAYGTPAERANFQISGAGYGIHWPDLDEDLGVAGLLLGQRSTESPTSFERWLQRREQKECQNAA